MFVHMLRSRTLCEPRVSPLNVTVTCTAETITYCDVSLHMLQTCNPNGMFLVGCFNKKAF